MYDDIMNDDFTASPEYFESFYQKPDKKTRKYAVHVDSQNVLLLSWELVYRVHIFAGDLAYALIRNIYTGIVKKDPKLLLDDGLLTDTLSDALEQGLQKYAVKTAN